MIWHDKDLSNNCCLFCADENDIVQELYGVGARRIGVLGLPPIGCVPVQRTLNGGIARGCSDFANQAAQIYNSKLQSVVDSLSKEFPDSRFVYFDIYNPLNSLIQNPPQYGKYIETRTTIIIFRLLLFFFFLWKEAYFYLVLGI